MKRTTSAREYACWREFHKQYPFDDESVHAIQVARLECTVSNMFRDKNHQLPPSDFLVAHRRRKRQKQDGVNLDLKVHLLLGPHLRTKSNPS